MNTKRNTSGHGMNPRQFLALIPHLRTTPHLKENRTMIETFLELVCAFFSNLETFIAFACVAVCLCHVLKCPEYTLKLFKSQAAITGGTKNTLFSTTATEITEANASEFFRFDHTPILFKGGYCKGENFEYATCVPFDIDNSHSDNPDDWISPEDVQQQLQHRGINYWMVSSRNHFLSKEEKAPRPKFHVYLPLAETLSDSDKFVRYCKWCIETFAADPKVKSKSQKLFGFGDNPNAFVECWNEGRCIDEVWSDDDLIAPIPVNLERKSTLAVSAGSPPQNDESDFDWFVNSGEWRNHLGDLEELGWEFLEEKNEQLFLRTPQGDRSPGKQDGNIKGGVVYIFSQASPPFENGKGYSICQWFAGILFGDTSSVGLAKFAERYLHRRWCEPQKVLEKVGVDILDSFLDQVTRVAFAESEDKAPSGKDYYVLSIDHLLILAKENHWDIGIKNGSPYFFNGEYWERIESKIFRRFLQAVGARQGIPHKIIRDHTFADKLEKQFASEARFPILAANDTPKINLRNCTLHFTSNGVEPRPFDKQDGLTYQLNYDYGPSETAPVFQKFFDRVLPDAAAQKLISQYIGYVFLRNMNLEKVLFLYGGGANGKSVFLNVIRGLIGDEQCCAYSLEELTSIPSTRAELGKYLLNVCTEMSGRMRVDVFKKIASREPIAVNPKYKDPYILQDYATCIFAANELPKNVEQNGAFFRRFIIIPFEVRIPEDEQDPDLAKKIIDSEMPGVLNFVIEGVKSLLVEGKFDIPKSVRSAVENFQKESDTVLTYMEENGYRPGTSETIPLQQMHFSYMLEYPGGVDKRNFSKRLRDIGYEVKRAGKVNTVSVYLTRSEVDENE